MTERLDRSDIAKAAALLREGGLVAFPTETVYGLGADATNGQAVARVYEAKGRPSFNPLIIHVPDLESAERYGVFDATARALAQAFWPGALTLVVPVQPKAGLSELVTAGLETVAIRVPDFDLARALLQEVDRPIAAPSANPSGAVSPTAADHVLDGLAGRIDAVLDGGSCSVGVESTIVGGDPLTLLRPGGIPREAIEACIGAPLLTHVPETTISAPGQLASHYAPNAALRLNVENPDPGETLLGFDHVEAEWNLSPAGDLIEAAANLFAMLRAMDAAGVEKIAVSPIPDHGLGLAINDRLKRAAVPRDET